MLAAICACVILQHIHTPHTLTRLKTVEVVTISCLSAWMFLTQFVSFTYCVQLDWFIYFFLTLSLIPAHFSCVIFSTTAVHVTAKTMRLRMRKASQQPNPSLAARPSRTKRKHSEVEEDTPTSGGRGLFSTIKKFIRGNAVKVTSRISNDLAFQWSWVPRQVSDRFTQLLIWKRLGGKYWCFIRWSAFSPPIVYSLINTELPKLFFGTSPF